MNNTLEMPTLYKRLSNIGLPQKYIQEKALPEWWDTELENDPVAVLEVAGRIAKRLGLDMASVLNPDAPITFKKISSPKFKKTQKSDENRLVVAQGLAARIAEMVTYACKQPFLSLSTDAVEIRDSILEKHTHIDLDAVLNFCWRCGIPVVHFSEFPKGVIKMDGMAAFLNGRPVIVLSSNHKYSAQLLFIILHEIGHIASGHVQDCILIDEKITKEIQDTEENQANDFAKTILFGEPDKYQWGKQSDSIQLARVARQLANKDRVQAGALALNYAWQRNEWNIGVGALKILEPRPNAPVIVNRYLEKGLDWESLDPDSEEYLKFVTGV
ncbi:ImmA/IrrE family metallo-endopeptidase [Anabaena sp. FACHB-1237]|uniref:ImmA/IrrE family metallo-endopeptidase n=1 Tax=Anabaena sp. FACHB-1237 TaxID=2692769 RepID=UPI0016806F78|nr:ImmA/IrrE family metallo-endopeptidase [Anabaena sp. FACHB-1237]MBD2139647.1 ImmA/IrrE family metallo-endopeptidase [Anabaena sp. FACHB-1237]